MVNYRTVLFIISTALPALAFAAIVYISVGDKNSVIDRLIPPGSFGPAAADLSADLPAAAFPDRVGAEDNADDGGAELPDQRPGAGFFASIASGSEMDPIAGKGFLLSVLVRIDQLPNNDQRQKIVSKFVETQPLVGWSLALRRYNGIVRPEVYYRGNNGKGGWYPFEQVQIDPNAWYNVSLIVNPGDWMVLFWEPAIPGAENVLGDMQGGSERQALVDAVAADNGKKTVVFLGGHDLKDVEPPATSADLLFGAKRAKGIFYGEVGAVLVAWLDGIPGKRNELRDLVTGGAPGIERRLNQQAIGLLVNRQGKDLSRFGRSVTILGG